MNDRQFLLEIFAKQAHQEIHFRLGPAPVLHGKSVQRQRGKMQARAGFDGLAGGAHAGAVPGDAWQMALLRPAPVAIHDDGHVARQTLDLELLEKRGFNLVGWFEKF